MDQPNLKILTPCYMGQVHSSYTMSMLNFFPYAQQHGIIFSVEMLPNCSLISLGRTAMLYTALKDKTWTHIMWIDADVEFEPHYIHSMILDDKDILGGFYPKKGLPIEFASYPYPGGEDSDVLFETSFVATGFMLVKREVIEKMCEHYREELEMVYQGDEGIVHLFHPIIDRDLNNLYLTEDFSFCKRARDIGFRCYMSKRFALPHNGTISYSVEYENMMLQAYEDAGIIKVNKDKPRNYFPSITPKDNK